MERYIVIEIQTNDAGKTATLLNAYEAEDIARQKYFTILAAAAVSNLPVHGAVLMDVQDTYSRLNGLVVEQRVFYRNDTAPES